MSVVRFTFIIEYMDTNQIFFFFLSEGTNLFLEGTKLWILHVNAVIPRDFD